MEFNVQMEGSLSDKIPGKACPNCGASGMKVFFEVKNIPVHNVMLVFSKEEALAYPKGDIELGFCSFCGFISNLAFDPSKLEYSAKCEETQGFSPTFNVFHKNLAQQLIGKYNLFNKEIIEIGCGKGEFLTMLCELGNNKGYGFDPAYVAVRNQSQAKNRIIFIEDFYSEKYSDYKADFICCKMTLEHIPDTFEFVKMMRRSIGENLKSIVFFQIPDVTRILRELGFWDIYYEHCSYFSPVSITKLFLNSGFEIIDLYRGFEDQYIMIEARPTKDVPPSYLEPVEDVYEIFNLVSNFSTQIKERFNSWKEQIKSYASSGKRVVIWGGGSKAVSFLTTLGIIEEIKYVVDINPYKDGTFIVGTGQQVVSPEFLKDYKPDKVIVMNPVYMDEVRYDLTSLGLEPELIRITAGD